MKYCPKCRTEYADDSLQFCLQDGTPLAAPASQSSSDFEIESETLVVPKQVQPIRFEPPSSYQGKQENWQPSPPVAAESIKKKSNTATIIAVSVLGTILLLGLGGFGAWLYFKNSKAKVAVNVNTVSNRQTNSSAANNQNANANIAAVSPTATPTAQSTLDPKQWKAVTNDVKNVVDEWKNASENLDLDTHLDQYASTVDYYQGGRVSVAKIRADRQNAYEIYDSMDIAVDNLKITPDASGNKATAVFDKKWKFEGAQSYSSGKVQQQMQFEKINGRWLITGEKDLKIYYVDK
jgi:hypothetical protein